jgi:hypothetical protein
VRRPTFILQVYPRGPASSSTFAWTLEEQPCTPRVREYLRNGGILPFVPRRLLV